jgi:DNA-binding NarL/FixJ family response regulator
MRPLRRATTDPSTTDPTRRRLSAREREVALLVADGLDDGAIAERLGLSPATVANYIKRIRLRLSTASRVDVARWINDRRDRDNLGARLRRVEAGPTA